MAHRRQALEDIREQESGYACVHPQNYMLPCTFLLMEPCTNNVAEYNTLLVGMKMAHEIGVKNLEVYSDSMLIVNKVCGEFKVWHENLVPYHTATIQLAEKLKSFYIEHLPHYWNAYADALASVSLALQPWALEKVLVFNHD